MNLWLEKNSILAGISSVSVQAEVVQKFDALGAIPLGYNGMPILEWIDEPGGVGQVDDPCKSIQQQINNLQTARTALAEDVLAASQAGDPAYADLKLQLDSLDASLKSLKASLANCKKLKPGCTTPDGTPSPECPPGQVCVGGKCVTPSPAPQPQCSDTKPCPAGQKCVAGTCVPATTSTSKPASRSWLLLAVAAVGATIFAFKGA